MKVKRKPSRAKLKKEYVTTDTSYRALSTKYDVSLASIRRYAKEDHWVQEKEAYISEISKTAESMISTVVNTSVTTEFAEEISTRAEFEMKLYHSADLLFNKVNEILTMDVPLAPKDLKSISSTLLDLKMMRITDVNEDAKKNDKMIVEFIDMDWGETT